MKAFSIGCGLLLMGYGALQTIAALNPKLERELCRHSACWNRDLAEEAYQRFAEGSVSTSQGVDDLTLELVHDPTSSFRWCDIGDALLASGDQAKAAYCMRRALVLGPNFASVLLRAANFDFTINAPAEGLAVLKHLIEVTPEFDAIAFSDFDRFGGGLSRVLAVGMPNDKRAALAFLRHLIGTKRSTAELAEAWAWLSRRSLGDEKIIVEYVNYLAGSRQFDSAVEIWKKAAGEHEKDYMRPNHVFNGDFEYPPTGAVLDWQVSAPDSVTVVWDTTERRSGARSLRLDFNAEENLSFNGVFQHVVVSPGRYRLAAFVKAEGITTDQGVGFHVFDAEAPARLDVASEALTGTREWSEQHLLFTAAGQTRLLRVELRREPSRKLDNKIHGQFWCDRVVLQPDK